MKKLFLILILLLFPVSVFAGEYVVVKGDESEGTFNRRQYRSQLYGQAEYVLKKGQGVEMCEAYKKELETLKIPDAYMCQIWMWGGLDYKFSDDFTRLIWKKLDLKQKKNRELFRRFLNYTSGTALYDNDAVLNKEIKGRNDRGKEGDLYTVSIDLDNDGKKENLLLYRTGFCPTHENFLAELFVLTDNSKVIDATHPIQKLFEQKLEKLKGAPPNRAVHVFKYKDSTYVGKYCGDDGSGLKRQVEFWKKKDKTVDIESYDRSGCREDNTLSVYSISKGAMEEVCKYQYKNNENK